MTLGHQQHWAETPYDTRALDHEGLALDVEPTDRVGAPLPSRTKSKLRRLIVGMVLIGGTWALVQTDPERAHGLVDSAMSLLEGVVTKAREMAAQSAEERAPATVAASAAPIAPLAPVAPLPPVAPIEHSSATDPANTAAQGEKAAAAGDQISTGSLGTAYAEKAEPAEAALDKSPKRKSAIAAGLSPDLPNVLLTRLSDADLKNARYAIKTALAKTPDDASFAWPKAPSREQALFEVRFVPGAAQGCRRYIVTVTKERWSSTSAAQEKCNDATPHAG